MPIKLGMGLGNIGRYAIEALEIQPISPAWRHSPESDPAERMRDLRGVQNRQPCGSGSVSASRMSCCCAPLPQDPRSRGRS